MKQQIEFIEIANDSKKDFNLSFNLSDNLLKYMKFSNDKIIDEFSKDYIFAYSVDKAVTRRLTQSRELHNSEYLYATQQIENPEYSKLLIEIQVISGQVDRAWASYERAKQRAEDYLSSQRVNHVEVVGPISFVVLQKVKSLKICIKMKKRNIINLKNV